MGIASIMCWLTSASEAFSPSEQGTGQDRGNSIREGWDDRPRILAVLEQEPVRWPSQMRQRPTAHHHEPALLKDQIQSTSELARQFRG
jgi:hypothetical protein